VPQFSQSADLTRFAQEFKDEACLRVALADLFSRAGFKSVRITHGTGEVGKDIVFYQDGGLSKDVLYACVVKNERITANVASKSASQSILNQALQALNEPFTNKITGKPEKVHTVYVVSPRECTPEAVEHIRHQLQDRARQVEFFCGVDLLSLFHRHWPEFLQFESNVLTRYLADLKAGLSVDKAIIDVLTRHNAYAGLKPFESLYVPQDLELRFSEVEASVQPPPNADVFDHYIRWEELQSNMESIRSWRHTLRAPEVLGISKEASSSLLNFLIELPRTLRNCWEKALHNKRFCAPGIGGASKEERFLELPLGIRDQWNEAFSVFNSLYAEVHRLKNLSRSIRAFGRVGGNLESQLAQLSVGFDLENAVPGLIRHDARVSVKLNSEDISRLKAILVTGAPGSGKTSFCRWQMINAIEKFASDQSEPLPVYVAAHRLAGSLTHTFESLFLRDLNLAELWPNETERKNVPIRLFLDGVDEVPDRDQQRTLMESLEQAMEDYPRLTIVVTSRPYIWGEWLHWIPRLSISELSKENKDRLAQNWLGDADSVSSFMKELENSSSLQKLMGSPLLATLMLNLYRKTKGIPETKSSLYGAFIDLYCGGWDEAKQISKPSNFRKEQKLRPLPALAYKMHLKHTTECTKEMLQSEVLESLPAFADMSDDFIEEVLQDGILVHAGASIMFSHLSFQEYLAAQHLSDDPFGRRSKLALRKYLLGEDWWKEVVEFYLVSRNQPSAIDDWVKRAASEIRRKQGKSTDLNRRLNLLASCIEEAFQGYEVQFDRRFRKNDITGPEGVG
jgi:hypothetical protein